MSDCFLTPCKPLLNSFKLSSLTHTQQNSSYWAFWTRIPYSLGLGSKLCPYSNQTQKKKKKKKGQFSNNFFLSKQVEYSKHNKRERVLNINFLHKRDWTISLNLGLKTNWVEPNKVFKIHNMFILFTNIYIVNIKTNKIYIPSKFDVNNNNN